MQIENQGGISSKVPPLPIVTKLRRYEQTRTKMRQATLLFEPVKNKVLPLLA